MGKTVKKATGKAAAKPTTSRAKAKPAEDTEGHMFMPYDNTTASSLARIRSAEIDRNVRERQRANEAKKKGGR